MLRPGYVETAVDRVMSRVAEEWGRADPALLPPQAVVPRAQRSQRDAPDSAATFHGNQAIEAAPDHEAPEGRPAREVSHSTP